MIAMRHVVLAATALFWLGVGGFAWQGMQAPVGMPGAAAPPTAASAAAVERSISLAELARHATAEDCWIAIDGWVYDLGAYVPLHPAEPDVLTAWCGREASVAYRTKGTGRPHSARADAMLPRYRVGRLGT